MLSCKNINRPTVAYLVSHPIQYHVPFFRKLSHSDTIEFVVLFGSDFGIRNRFDPGFNKEVDFGINLLDGYKYMFLSTSVKNPRVDRFFGLRIESIHALSSFIKPDCVVLHGWRTMMMWQAALGAYINKTRYFIRAETPIFINGKTTSRRNPFRSLLIKILLHQSSGVLALGKANERFYRRMHYPVKKIYHVPYYVDTNSVVKASQEGRNSKDQLRARHNIPIDAFLIISVGKLIPRKRPFYLLNVLKTLPQDIHVLWIGSGEQEESLSKRITEENLLNRFHLVGFKPPEETWKLLGIADIFALPSVKEPWGLVVNEALAANLPTLVTEECGSSEDLVIPQITGEVLPTNDHQAWRKAILTWKNKLSAGYNQHLVVQNRISMQHSLKKAVLSFENAIMDVLG